MLMATSVWVAEYPLIYTEGGWECPPSTGRDSRDASDVQHAWQEEPPKKNREEEEELSAGGVCLFCVGCLISL